MIKKLKSKKFWKRGSGELLGFCILMPFVVLLLCGVVSSTQVGVMNQTLNYTAYDCCRSAVVSETYDLAKKRAIETYEVNMCSISNATKNHNYTPVELEIVDGPGWEKGSLVKCTVRYYIEPLMPFTSGVREQSITMMIENGDLNK